MVFNLGFNKMAQIRFYFPNIKQPANLTANSENIRYIQSALSQINFFLNSRIAQTYIHSERYYQNFEKQLRGGKSIFANRWIEAERYFALKSTLLLYSRYDSQIGLTSVLICVTIYNIIKTSCSKCLKNCVETHERIQKKRY